MASIGVQVLFGGPVAYHRLTFHRHEKARLVRVSNRMAIAGLGVVALDVGLAVTLVLTFVIPILARRKPPV